MLDYSIQAVLVGLLPLHLWFDQQAMLVSLLPLHLWFDQQAAIVWESREALWLVGSCCGLASLALLIGYSGVHRPLLFKLGLGAMKFAGVALVALCLLNPLWTENRIKPGENIVLLLADVSASMQIRHGAEKTRGDFVREQLAQPDLPWQTRLAQDFDVRRYTFGERLTQVQGFETLNFDRSASNLNNSLTAIQDRFQQLPIAAVLLFTDGNSTDQPRDLPLDFPIYPVLFPPAAESLRDLAIQHLTVGQSAFEDAPVSIAATMTSQGIVDEKVTFLLEELTSAREGQSQTQQLSIHPDEPTTARFQVRPSKSGICFYRLRIHAANEAPFADDADSLDIPTEETSENAAASPGEAAPLSKPKQQPRPQRPPQTQEVTLANNERIIVIDRGSAEHRILYVGGRPNWEHKFLNRALAEDEQIQLVSMIRIAKREAKFDFRGRAGEDSNSLFRGFKENADAETEAYDQPVVVRLNTKDREELSDGFPKTKEQLFTYEALILDDVEAAFFTQDQLELIDRFVAERGGGLLMLGGRDSYRHGDWQKSPLRDVLPIYLDTETTSTDGKMRWDLTRDGWLEPWMRLRETEEADRNRMSTMPQFELANTVREIKPGARVVAKVQDEQGQDLPALVIQQYGKGQAGAMLVGDFWKWALHREDEENDDLPKAWRQAIRWLISDVPTRIEAGIVWTDLGQIPAVNLRVVVRDKEYQPQDNAAVELSIQQPDDTSVLLTGEPSLTQPGLFEATYVPRQKGAYRATISVKDEQGLPSGKTEIGWSSDLAADEFEVTTPNTAWLTELAEQTNGEVVQLADLEQFVATLPTREMPVTEVASTPLWHTPWILILAIGLLAGEWGLRRWRGLP